MSRIMSSRPMDRSYKSAINILHSRRRPERPSIKAGSYPPGLNRIPDAQGKPDLKGTPSIVGMKRWLHQIGHSVERLPRSTTLTSFTSQEPRAKAVVHVHSSSPFSELSGQGPASHEKTGLYTSPHLIYPEERIRINFQPIARDLFARHFFQVWDVLSEDDSNTSRTLPRYFQLLALVSFHAFIREGVEAAICETHHGGEYDATNAIIEHPVATVITTLGMDHVKQLGPTIENIAWHKAGIFKHATHALSSPQEASAADVLRRRAAEKGVNLQFVENDASLPADALQLRPGIQRTNCSVALAAVRCFLEQKRAHKDAAPILSSSDIPQGIRQFSWPGRFQLVVQGAFSWFLDGAHNETSVRKAAEWFIESLQGERESRVRILIFSQVSEQRDAKSVLEQLATALSTRIHIHHVIFTLYDPEQQDLDSTTAVVAKSNDTLQQAFGETWKKFHRDSRVLCEPDIQKALDSAREIGTEARGMQTLITGSQHLVGAALDSLNRNSPSPGSV